MNKNELLKLEEQIKNNATDIKEILCAVQTNSSNIERNSLALDILKDYKKERDRAFLVIVILLIIVIMLASIVIYHHWIV